MTLLSLKLKPSLRCLMDSGCPIDVWSLERNEHFHRSFMSDQELNGIIGEVIDDRYKIGRCLGMGTMGSVYEAEHILMKKTVALKMLHPSHTRDKEVVQRFRREAQAAANIEHPNICSATDFGMYDSETYYLVMEFLDGLSLSELMEKETLGLKRSIHITKQILAALKEAHKIGVVHRDLKPENILIIKRDEDPYFAKITDFGVAQVRIFKNTQRITQVGMVYGSPLYMSPEQAQGEEVDHRADLYSVGVMLYEMLIGAVPFYARALNVVLSMHVSDPPKPFSEVDADHEIPPAYEALVMKLLSKNPNDRFQSAGEVYQALVDLDPKEPGQLTPQKSKSSTLRIAFAIAGIGFLLFLAIFLLSRNHGNEEGIEKIEEKELVFVPQEIDQNREERQAFLTTINEGDLEKQIVSAPKGTLEKLETLVEETPESSHLQFLYGKALVSNKAYEDGMERFKKAIEINSKYASDSSLLDDVFRTFENRKWKNAEHANRLILSTIKEGAKSRLAELAEHHRSSRVRKRGLKLLKELGLFSKLEKWNQLTISLRHAQSCEDNRLLIVEIGALGDPKAMGSLRRFASNPKNGCKGKDCWACARNDVRIGIEKLSAK